ncbi:hypothetical protein [Streptomyces sp. NPDC001389]|uniref:hypothetical protein n=1 Tax=unclassified Streptomyces TaxID=2593676 RepID=UPI0036C5B842
MPETTPGTAAPAAVTSLPPLAAQTERLIDLGVHERAGISAAELRAFAERAGGDTPCPGPADPLSTLRTTP